MVSCEQGPHAIAIAVEFRHGRDVLKIRRTCRLAAVQLVNIGLAYRQLLTVTVTVYLRRYNQARMNQSIHSKKLAQRARTIMVIRLTITNMQFEIELIKCTGTHVSTAIEQESLACICKSLA